MDLRSERPNLRSERLDLTPERLDLRPELPYLKPERPDLRPEGPDAGEGTNKRKSPCVLQDFVPFQAAAAVKIIIKSNMDKQVAQGQYMVSDTHCPALHGCKLQGSNSKGDKNLLNRIFVCSFVCLFVCLSIRSSVHPP